METPITCSNLIEDITERQISIIQEKKEKLIYERLKSLNIQFDIEKEKQRRFKNIMAERSLKEETYYYNDGSINGLRIITFVYDYMNSSIIDRNKITYNLKYY